MLMMMLPQNCQDEYGIRRSYVARAFAAAELEKKDGGYSVTLYFSFHDEASRPSLQLPQLNDISLGPPHTVFFV